MFSRPTGWPAVTLTRRCRWSSSAVPEPTGIPNRHGHGVWYASRLRGMLNNTACTGRAIYRHSRYLPAPPRLRPVRGQPHPSAHGAVAVPRGEWIEVPVPALVDEAVFEAAQDQLAENRQRNRGGLRGPRWLLPGRTVCRRCGDACYGKMVPKSSKHRPKGEYRSKHPARAAEQGWSGRGGVAVIDGLPIPGQQIVEA